MLDNKIMNLINQLGEIEQEISQLTEIEDTYFREEVRKELNDKKHKLLNLLTFKRAISTCTDQQLCGLLGDLSLAVETNQYIESIQEKINLINNEIFKRG